MKPNKSPAASAPETASPFPPPFRWAASPSEAPTQVMRALRPDTAQVDPAEATQVLRTSPAYQRQRPEEVGDLFQPAQLPRRDPLDNSDSSAPPWADTEAPSLAEQQSAWLGQGPETARQSRSKQVIGITVLSVVVLGLVGATVAYSLTSGPGRADSDQIAAPQPSTAPRDLPAPPAQLPEPGDTADALIDPPGQIRGNGPFDLAQLSTDLLPSPILDALHVGAMTGGVFKGTTVGANDIGMFALTMPDQQAAAKVAGTIVSTEASGGLKADNTRAQQGVAVMGSVPGSNDPVYRAVYVLYKRVIFFEVRGKNRDEVLATFDALLKEQVTHAPPTIR